MTIDTIDLKLLRKMYVEDHLSTWNLADYFGVCQYTICSRLDTLGIMRTNSEANTEYHIDEDILRKMYLADNMSISNIAAKLGVSYIVIYVRLHRIGIVRSLSEAGVAMWADPEKRMDRIDSLQNCHRLEIDTDKLKEMYVTEGMSTWSIANAMCVSQGLIASRLREMGALRSLSEVNAARWKDPSFRESQLKAMQSGRFESPNWREKLIFGIADALCPGEFGLNTNGEVQTELGLYFDGRKPDILSLNGRKQIILHNGCYWHCCELCGNGDITIRNGKTAEQVHEDNAKILQICKDLGYDVLTIWEHEENDVMFIRIRNFVM